jgi:hypothetical protein
MEISGALFQNLTASQLVKSGVGKVYGVIVNSHTSGTMKLQDGVDDTAGVQATGTLTIAGGSLVPAVHATNTLTSDATNVADAETVTIGSVVYRFKNTPAQAFDVQIGADAATSLANLKKAINGTGTPGTEYFAGTVAHTLIIAATLTTTTVKIYSRTYGTGNNALATTETSAHLSWADTTLGGGTGVSDPGVATSTASFTINGDTYYFTTELSETVGVTAVKNEILWVTSDAVALDNMKLAINGTGTEGTDYSTGTNSRTDVIATTNTNTAQTIQAVAFGTAGNSITTTSTATHATWAAVTLASGTDAARLICNTFSFPTGSGVYKFPEPINFVNGLFFTVGGTLDCTVIFN